MMNRAIMLHGVGWMAVAALPTIWGACVIEVEDIAEGRVESAVVQGPCPTAGCGENSPVIAGLGFHELNLVGLVNNEGFWIPTVRGRAQIDKNGSSYDLNVVNGFITGSRNSVVLLSGTDLEGTTITVQHRIGKFTLRIRSVRPFRFFLPPTDPIETYDLQWAKDNDDYFVNLCGGIPLLLDEGYGAGGKHHSDVLNIMNMTMWEAVVFHGDRIDSKKKEMSKTATDTWFTIGCATSTPAKMFLTHHTIHSQAVQPRAWEKRQAMLKLLVADYCGTGASFTVARQKLVWKSSLVNYVIAPWKLEARWTEDGAKCLNNPRMLYPSTPLGPVYFPDIRVALNAAGCHPPICWPNIDTADLAGTDRGSSNPVP